MYRILVIIGLLILLYFLIRRAVSDWRETNRGSNRITADDMIQDPVCHLYVPRENAKSARIGGQTYYFCGEECAKTFQKRLSA